MVTACRRIRWRSVTYKHNREGVKQPTDQFERGDCCVLWPEPTPAYHTQTRDVIITLQPGHIIMVITRRALSGVDIRQGLSKPQRNIPVRRTGEPGGTSSAQSFTKLITRTHILRVNRICLRNTVVWIIIWITQSTNLYTCKLHPKEIYYRCYRHAMMVN